MHAYWTQWSLEELLSIQGIEKEDNTNFDQNEDEKNLDQNNEDYLTLDILGMSWKDFV